MNLTTLQAVMESLRADLDTIMEAPSGEPVEDTVLVAILSTTIVPPPPPRDHAKRQRVREEDESRAWKKERS